jgi:drug/metabolite transporter (DMT)-like permease
MLVATAAVWGSSYMFIKVALDDFSEGAIVCLRTALGAALLLPFAWRELRALLPRWRPVVVFTVVELAIPWLLLSDAERHVPSSLAGLLMAAVPLVGAVVARASGGREPLGGRRLAGLVVGLAGVGALLGLDLGTGDLGAVAKLAVVVVGYAIGPLVVSRRLAGVPSRAVIAASLALCAAGYAPVGIAQLPPALPSADVVVAVVVLGAVCTALAFLVFFALIAEIGPVRSTVVTYVNPAVAVAAGVALLGEAFTRGMAAGFVLILAGSWLATGAPRPAPALRRAA